MRSQRYRTRLLPKDLQLLERLPPAGPINQAAHEAVHGAERWIYNSKPTLNLDVGTLIPPTFGGYITGVRLSVPRTGVPSSTLTCDILINQVSIFPLSPKPTILAGEHKGRLAISDISFNPDDDIEVQLIDTGGATGPMVVQIEYLRAL